MNLLFRDNMKRASKYGAALHSLGSHILKQLQGKVKLRDRSRRKKSHVHHALPTRASPKQIQRGAAAAPGAGRPSAGQLRGWQRSHRAGIYIGT